MLYYALDYALGTSRLKPVYLSNMVACNTLESGKGSSWCCIIAHPIMEEAEKVRQFASVTGSSEDIARKYLEACAGDINMAIGMHLENGSGSFNAVVPGSSQKPEALVTPMSYEKVHGVRAPIPQTTGVLIEEDAPPRKVLRSRKLPQTVFDPFQDYSGKREELLDEILHAAIASTTGNQAHGSNKQKLAEMFRPPHDLLFSGTFHEAKLAGQHKHCWLLINLQDSKEFASQVLNRDVWSNYNVKDLVKKHFIFMQIYRINDEGVQFKQLYNIESCPCIAVIDPRTGEKMISWTALKVTDFIREVSEFLANNHYEEASNSDQTLRLCTPPVSLGHENNRDLITRFKCAQNASFTGCHRENSVINLSEESQLEAAIKASLQDVHPPAVDKQAIAFSDDSDIEYVSFSPDEEVDFVGNISDTKTVGQPSLAVGGTSDSGRTKPVKSCDSKHEILAGSRKRLSGCNDELKDCPRKRIRTDLDPVCIRIDNIELTRSMSTDIPDEDGSSDRKMVNGKGRRGNNSKGKGKAKASEIDYVWKGINTESTVEELLESGDLHKDDITQILFRLPDGTRLQKTFLSRHPISVLFDFLEGQGLKITEHEIVTHFPRRSLLDMDCTTSFRHNQLYPRETIFVHTI